MAWTVEATQVTYCPLCGRAIDIKKKEDQSLPHCFECDFTIYRNPVPMGRATVVDDDRALLIERGEPPDSGEWALAGGHLEYDESPREGAARELKEETGLSVPPNTLTLIGEGFLDFGDGMTMVSFNYAAPTVEAEGTIQAADDAASARFWSRDELQINTPQLRASGLEQILSAIDEVGRS